MGTRTIACVIDKLSADDQIVLILGPILGRYFGVAIYKFRALLYFLK